MKASLQGSSWLQNISSFLPLLTWRIRILPPSGFSHLIPFAVITQSAPRWNTPCHDNGGGCDLCCKSNLITRVVIAISAGQSVRIMFGAWVAHVLVWNGFAISKHTPFSLQTIYGWWERGDDASPLPAGCLHGTPDFPVLIRSLTSAWDFLLPG